MKEAAVPNILPRKTSWQKNVNKKGKQFFVSNLQYSQFEQVGWKNRANFMEDWILTCSQNI